MKVSCFLLFDRNTKEKKMNEQLITTRELAKQLKTPLSWVYSRTRQRGPDSIPKIQCGKYLRFRLSEVLEWLKKQQVEEYES
jgi:excisionase family DNA binding protein